MSTYYEYITAFWPHWWPVVIAGTYLGFDEIVCAWFPRMRRHLDKVPERWRRRFSVAALFLALFYAGFQAWQEEHTAKIAFGTQRDEARGELKSGSLVEQVKANNQLRSEINELREKLRQVSIGNRDENKLYVKGIEVATIGKGQLEPTTGVFNMQFITANRMINFPQEVEFRNFRFVCESGTPTGAVSMGAFLQQTYINVTCRFIGHLN